MMTRFSLLTSIALLSGCATLTPATAPTAPPEASGKATVVSRQPLGNRGYSAASLDKTTEAERKAALAAPKTGGALLGKSVVALGPPSDPGLWVQSPHIKAKAQGRITAPNGKALALELRPASGAALLSFSAYQALGIGLTELPEVSIYSQ